MRSEAGPVDRPRLVRHQTTQRRTPPTTPYRRQTAPCRRGATRVVVTTPFGPAQPARYTPFAQTTAAAGEAVAKLATAKKAAAVIAEAEILEVSLFMLQLPAECRARLSTDAW
ncbi:MAG: hypothetical protein DI527_22475 [Chelatococcus sp.]|nr:MAG: hypothetical protein DI527_22475 [Chelatococcus sp.]